MRCLPALELAHLWPSELILSNSSYPAVFVGIERYAKNLKTLVFVLFVELDNMGVLLAAGTTSRSPKIDEHDLTTHIA